jgi:hypothetical protein
MVNNNRGVVALAVILSMLMVIGAIGVFGFVSGRLGTTYKLSRRPQAILDAESASYVTYMLMREGIWARTDADADTKQVQLAHKLKLVDVDISDTVDSKVSITSPYK